MSIFSTNKNILMEVKYINSHKRIRIVIIMFVLIFLFARQYAIAGSWRLMKYGREFGISGMAPIEQNTMFSSFLIVHDCKKKDEIRLAVLTINNKDGKFRYSALKWPNDINLPIDLEAITFVPDRTKISFMALASEGKIYHIKLDLSKENISIIKVFSLPDVSGGNFEGFVLQEIDDKLLALWASRGKDNQPAIIYWGLLDLATYKFSQIGSVSFKVPWPSKPEVRHISDLKVDQDGILFISSASDSGDNGPFQSALYIAGVFNICNNQVNFQKNIWPLQLYQFRNHKVEAFELGIGYSKGMIFASDDENLGSSIYADW